MYLNVMPLKQSSFPFTVIDITTQTRFPVSENDFNTMAK